MPGWEMDAEKGGRSLGQESAGRQAESGRKPHGWGSFRASPSSPSAAGNRARPPAHRGQHCVASRQAHQGKAQGALSVENF